MIDRTKRRWTANSHADLIQYLKESTGREDLEEHRLSCPDCSGTGFALQPVDGQGQICLRCLACGREWALPGGMPQRSGVKGLVCQGCKQGRRYELSLGRGEDRVYLGSRCCTCGALDIPLSWEE